MAAGQGPFRPPDRRDRAARVPHPVPAGVARRPDHLLRRRDRAPDRTRCSSTAPTPGATCRAAPSRPELEAQVREVDGVARPAGSARAPSASAPAARSQAAAVIGYERRVPSAHPQDIVAGRLPTAEGEGICERRPTRRRGSGSATWCGWSPAGSTIRIVGPVDGHEPPGATDDLHHVPDVGAGGAQRQTPTRERPLPNALGLEPAPGVRPDELVRRVNRVSPDLEAFDPRGRRDQGAGRRPGRSLVHGDLPALRPGGAARHRSVLPHRHAAEGAHAHAPSRDRRPLQDARRPRS